MSTETATLLALIVTPLAVVALAGATLAWFAVGRTRQTIGARTSELPAREVAVRVDLAAARDSLERSAAAARALRMQGRTLEMDLAAWTESLSKQRKSIERLSRARVGPAVRVMQLAGALARVALLWRAPAR